MRAKSEPELQDMTESIVISNTLCNKQFITFPQTLSSNAFVSQLDVK